MTQQIALNHETNDIIKKDTGGIERVNEGRYVVQNVRSRLQTALGEWLLNPTLGWINDEDFVKDYDLYDIEDRARTIILRTPNVQTIESINLRMEGRKLILSFVAETEFGSIDLTVPWETS